VKISLNFEVDYFLSLALVDMSVLFSFLTQSLNKISVIFHLHYVITGLDRLAEQNTLCVDEPGARFSVKGVSELRAQSIYRTDWTTHGATC